MKRILAIFLTVMMLLSALPLAGLNIAPKAIAEEAELAPTGQCGENAYWNFDKSTGTLTISGTGELGDSQAGSHFEFYFDYASLSPFAWNTNIKEVIIKEGIESIAPCMFLCCENISSVVFPDSLYGIGDGAFEHCYSLTSIVLPQAAYIGEFAFDACGNQKSVTLSENVGYIGRYAFDGSEKTDIYYNGTKEMWDCIHICDENIGLDNASIHIDKHQYGKCGSDVFWELDDETGILTISGTGEMFDYDHYYDTFISPFKNKDEIKKVIIEDGITYIGEYAFSNCNSLISASIPDSVTCIGDYAFYPCQNLSRILYYGTVEQRANIQYRTYIDNYKKCNNIDYFYCMQQCGENVYWFFDEETDTLTFTGTGNMYDYEYRHMPFYDPYAESGYYNWVIKNIVIENGVTGVCDSAFSGFSYLESIVIPDSITKISLGLFDGCHSLKSFVIPDSITSIGEAAFVDCSNLSSIKIPDSVINIDAGAFYKCSNLTSITIPYSVTSIGYTAFGGCGKLESIVVDKNNVKYDSRNNCNAIIQTETNTLIRGCQNTIIPDSVTSIGDSAFDDCNGLTSITIPDSITSIGQRAFGWCNSLSDVYFGGTREQWDEISISIGNEPLLNATIHCIDDHVHTLSHIVTPASCVVKGMEYDICVECGEILNNITTPEKGHTWGEWVTVTEPTVDAEGLEQRECTVCKEEETQPIPKLNVAKDEASGVEIVFSDEFDKDVEVNVSDAFDGQSLQLIDAKYPSSQTAIFDISTYKDGEKVQPDGKVTVRIPLPEGFGTENIFVCYVDSVNGNVTSIPTTVENGYVIFTAEHFSHYAIIELLDSFVNYIKNAGIEINDKIACGFLPGTTVSDLKNLASFICDTDVKTADGSDTIGTGSSITFTSITGKVIECTAIVFGDTNGDGWYDGMDSVITNCLANGILSKEQVGEAVFAAANCNHDNVVDENDVAVLEQAGLILAKINQSKSAEELLADESYSEYISLIDQTVKAEEAPADSTTDNTVDEEFNMSFIQRIFEFIMNILNIVKSFVSQF